MLTQLLIAFGILIILWLAADYFSPHPALTMIVKVIVFIAFIVLMVSKLLPLAGIHLGV